MTVVRSLAADLAPERKAELIYTQARSELADRLWRVAIGDAESAVSSLPGTTERPAGMALDQLMAMLMPPRHDATSASPAQPNSTDLAWPSASQRAGQSDQPAEEQAASETPQPPFDIEGANAQHRPALEAAATRTGIPAAAIAAIVNAEAAKNSDGSWKCYSRNPRSSAAGLGQFLSGTWEGMAQIKGTWLNGVARARGWLDDAGHVLGCARSELLQLRYDASASIATTADYARMNLDKLKAAGVRIGGSAMDIAQAAYVGHHLGSADAIRFMKQGLDPERARHLLNAQVGAADASRRIADAGDAVQAHRNWFLSYVHRNLKPERFAA